MCLLFCALSCASIRASFNKKHVSVSLVLLCRMAPGFGEMAPPSESPVGTVSGWERPAMARLACKWNQKVKKSKKLEGLIFVEDKNCDKNQILLKYSLYSERRHTLRSEGEIPWADVTVWDAKSQVTVCCFLKILNMEPKSDKNPCNFKMILTNSSMVTTGSLNTVRSRRKDRNSGLSAVVKAVSTVLPEPVLHGCEVK